MSTSFLRAIALNYLQIFLIRGFKLRQISEISIAISILEMKKNLEGEKERTELQLLRKGWQDGTVACEG